MTCTRQDRAGNLAGEADGCPGPREATGSGMLSLGRGIVLEIGWLRDKAQEESPGAAGI